MSRPKGYCPDRPGQVMGEARRLLVRAGKLAAPPASFSLADLIVERLDQGRASSCVSQALAQSVRLRWSYVLREAGLMGTPPLISRMQNYWALRCLGGRQYMDAGGYPSDGVRALNEGYAVEADCPYSDDPLLQLQPMAPAVYRLSEDRRAAVEQHCVSDEPGPRAEEMKQLLWAGFFPCLGLLCDQAFEDLRVGTWDFVGPSLGGHYVVAVGWTPEGVQICNSWADWGENGCGIVGWDTIGQPELVTDVRAISITKMPDLEVAT